MLSALRVSSVLRVLVVHSLYATQTTCVRVPRVLCVLQLSRIPGVPLVILLHAPCVQGALSIWISRGSPKMRRLLSSDANWVFAQVLNEIVSVHIPRPLRRINTAYFLVCLSSFTLAIAHANSCRISLHDCSHRIARTQAGKFRWPMGLVCLSTYTIIHALALVTARECLSASGNRLG